MRLFATAQTAAVHQLDAAAARLPGLLAALVVLLVAWIAARLVRGSVRRVLARVSTEGHVDFVVARLAYWSVLAVGTVAALSALGVSVGALVAGFGLTGVAVALALKDILGNFMAGIVILLSRPFTIGEKVRIDAIEGTVVNVRIRDTVLKAADGTVIYLPNDKVYAAAITNLSASSRRLAEVRVPVELTSDIAAAEAAAKEAMAASAMVSPEPVPEVLIDEIADGAAVLACRFWVDVETTALATARSEVAAALVAAMGDAGVTLK